MDQGVIYDFGMNNGDDVEYYLLKGCKVIGVDANPSLCKSVEGRFAAEIAEGRLKVLNVALSANGSGSTTAFYLHRHDHVLSQLAAPNPDAAGEFERIEVPCRRASDIIRENGDPRYVKIDIEGGDGDVLFDLFEAGINPPEISAESHTIDVFARLVAAGYGSFALVDGETVPLVYRETTIATATGPRTFQFKPHSAGPFGADIQSEWQDPETFFYTLANAGLGWKDIHASRLIPPEPEPRLRVILARQLATLARRVARGLKDRALSSW
jgi:FkbM family methyltransferase